MTPPSETPVPPGEEPQDSILGSLPRSRPSVRSPRRDQAARAREARAARAARAKPKERAPRAERERAAPAAEKAAPGAESGGAGVEDLARAGVTTAVQVAGAGLRFAGKAAGAIRESLERR